MSDSEEASVSQQQENTGDDTFEFLDTDELQRQVSPILEKILGSGAGNFDRYKSASQVAIGGTSGWIVGCVFSKVGRLAASTLGGGLLLLQIAHRCGYVSINWKKINRDIQRSKMNLPVGVANNPQMQGHINRAVAVAKENAAMAVGFVGGFLLGMAT